MRKKREDIDGHRTAGHGRGAEGPSVERSDDGEEHQRSRDEVSGEEQREAEVADQQDLLAGEAVDDEAAERPHAQRRQGVAAQYDAVRRLHHPANQQALRRFRLKQGAGGPAGKAAG